MASWRVSFVSLTTFVLLGLTDSFRRKMLSPASINLLMCSLCTVFTMAVFSANCSILDPLNSSCGIFETAIRRAIKDLLAVHHPLHCTNCFWNVELHRFVVLSFHTWLKAFFRYKILFSWRMVSYQSELTTGYLLLCLEVYFQLPHDSKTFSKEFERLIGRRFSILAGLLYFFKMTMTLTSCWASRPVR